MKQLAACAAALLVAVAPKASAGEPLPVSGPAIVMFWAPWCAPCRQELRDYKAMSGASAPLPLMVVALDTARAQMPLLGDVPRDRLRIANGSSVANLARWSPETTGLPLTIAFDERGRKCASHSARLDVESLARLINACKFER